MKIRYILAHAARYILAHAAISVVVLSLIALSAAAQNYPAPKEGTWIARDFRFHTGEVMPELRLHYTTVGEPSAEPVLILHGTAQSGAIMLSPAFAGELFGPGQLLDASKYFIILPDAIGHGKSSKPSDGMRAKFPRYNYDDMVAAQYKLVTEGLNIRHVRLVLGFSMGGMQTWIWGITYPDFMDALVPMASQPTEMSSRNWMMRRLVIDAVRNDPDWKDGNYTTQPRAFQVANVFFSVATNGGTLAYQKLAPTASWQTSCSTSASWRHSPPMPMTSCISGIRRATITPRPAWIGYRRPSWLSIPQMMSVIRQRPGSWIASSSA
jgi:homoserine O-acetyltransferase